MANKKTIVRQLVEGEYLGIKPPEYDFFKVDLKQHTTTTTYGKNEKIENTFSISIDRSNITQSFHRELVDNLKELFKMDFVKFDWDTKCFYFYTSYYSGSNEEQKAQLNSILNYLKEFDTTYASRIENSMSLFNEAIKDFKNYKDTDFAIKYHPERKEVLVLSLSYMGSDLFRTLASSSKKVSDFGETDIEQDFFNDLVAIKNKSKKKCFIIDPLAYSNIKELVETKKSEVESFLQKQTENAALYKEDFVSYEEDNVFNFKLKYLEDQGCFDFFCTGYIKKADINGYVDSRSLLAKWALNFILSEEYLPDNIPEDISVLIEGKDRSKAKMITEFHAECNDIKQDHYYKILLDMNKDSSVRDKSLFVPADNWPKLKKIYENFIEVNKLFSRPVQKIVLDNPNIAYRGSANVNFKEYPSIYIQPDCSAVLIYKITPNEKKVMVEVNGEMISRKDCLSTTIRGVGISYEEVKHFLNDHPMAEHIKANTMFLNTEATLYDRNSTRIQITIGERESAWEAIYSRFKLMKELKVNESTTVKKRKI